MYEVSRDFDDTEDQICSLQAVKISYIISFSDNQMLCMGRALVY